MLSTQEAQEILNDPNLTTEEVAEIRDAFQVLAQLILETFKSNKITNNNSGYEESESTNDA